MKAPVALLYVPADRPDRIPKAFGTGADMVIVDLEDAVAPAHKAAARLSLPMAAGEATAACGMQVRVNAPGTEWFDADLEAVAGLPDHVEVRVPKVEDPALVDDLKARLGGRAVHALVETATGVAALSDIASAAPASLGLGEADLQSELGIAGGPTLEWLRIQLVVTCRAAGLPAPVMSAYPHVSDESGLVADCRLGVELGYLGRTAIHPRQVPAIRAAFRPRRPEYERALAVLAGMTQATEAGSGVVVLGDGRFVDRAMVQGAERTVELYEGLGGADR